MAELENIKEVFNQAAVQAAMVVIMTLRNAEVGPWPTTAESHSEPQKQIHNGPIFEKSGA